MKVNFFLFYRVVVKVKRLGGGFGGKETRCTPLIVAAAFAASKVNLPVRYSLDRYQVRIHFSRFKGYKYHVYYFENFRKTWHNINLPPCP